MFGYLFFGLTILVYIALSFFVLQPAPSGGDQTYGWSYSAFVLIVAFGVSSLLLTINISINGGFDWISDAGLKRNAIVGILWLGMMTGVVNFISKPEYHAFYQLTGSIRLLSHIISYTAIWLPLLMLIAYYFFLKPQWLDSLSPNLFKSILVFASLAGFLLPITSKKIFKSYEKYDAHELAVNKAMKNINNYQDVMSLLYYAGKNYEGQIRNAALTKIKANKNLESELIDILASGSTPYSVIEFLDEYKVEHPERFTEPMTKGLFAIIKDMQEDIVNPYKGIYDIEILLRVLDGQFKESSSVFKPQILRLQEVMELPPAKSRVYDDIEKCNQTLNKNREGVKNWLARH